MRPTERSGRRKPGRRWIARLAAMVGALALPGCGTAGGTPSVDLDPLTVRRPEPTALAPVSFLSGCWSGRSASGTTLIEERWGPPSDDVMLGTTRFTRDGRTVSFEFGHMAATPEGIVYTPYPGGVRSADSFRLTSSPPGEALFEAPEHDYPKRIRYRLRSSGGMEVSIDGGPDDPSPRAWTLQRSGCEGLPAM